VPKRTWTDDQLRELVAASTTWNDVLRGLGLTLRGRNHVRITRRVQDLGLDTGHFLRVRRGSEDVELRAAIASSTTFDEVFKKMGIEASNAARERIVDRARVLGIATMQLGRAPLPLARRRKVRRWTDDDLRAAVSTSTSVACVIRALGLIAAGGNYEHIHRCIKELSLDTSHFSGSAWSRGRRIQRPSISLEHVLVADRWTSSHKLKLRLLRGGLKKAACELCGWAERAPDGRLPLELDHINGDKTDNRFENLRIVCPNCHSLQPTHRGLNQKRRKK
jgi:hypothetical protein